MRITCSGGSVWGPIKGDDLRNFPSRAWSTSYEWYYSNYVYVRNPAMCSRGSSQPRDRAARSLRGGSLTTFIGLRRFCHSYSMGVIHENYPVSAPHSLGPFNHAGSKSKLANQTPPRQKKIGFRMYATWRPGGFTFLTRWRCFRNSSFHGAGVSHRFVLYDAQFIMWEIRTRERA